MQQQKVLQDLTYEYNTLQLIQYLTYLTTNTLPTSHTHTHTHTPIHTTQMAAVATALAQGLQRDAEEGGQEEPPIIGKMINDKYIAHQASWIKYWPPSSNNVI